MSNLIQLQNGSKSYGPKNLFQNASFSINEVDHVGVIGANGSGKSTLFKVLIGKEELDQGQVIYSNGLRLGYLAQYDEWKTGQTVEEYLIENCIAPIWELKGLGRGLGLSEEIYASEILALSGGYRMRCKLLQLLGTEPDLLLLDEPTNYLDLESLIVLEDFLQNFKGAFLLISHDREFLNKTIDHVLELEAGDITKFAGGLEEYFEQKELLALQLESRALSVEQKKKEILDFVNRFGAKASKAKQAQSRLKSLDRLEKVEVKNLDRVARVQIPISTQTGKQILNLSDVSLGYGEKTVLKSLNFNVARGDRIAVVGVNGAGKSTLLKAIATSETLKAGKIEKGYGVEIGYYAQHVSEALDPNLDVFESMQKTAHPEVKPQEILNLAGSLLFSGDDVRKQVKVLSGGEKARVALGQILLKKVPCLVLDEPTNHLDFNTVEGLTQALSEFKGTLITVSHDRSFIRRVANKILEINHGVITPYYGSYDEYVWSVKKGMLSIRTAPSESLKKSKDDKQNLKPSPHKEHREKLKQLEKESKKFEKEIQNAETFITELNEKLISNPLSSELTSWIKELAHYQEVKTEFEEKWLMIESQLEALKLNKS